MSIDGFEYSQNSSGFDVFAPNDDSGSGPPATPATLALAADASTGTTNVVQTIHLTHSVAAISGNVTFHSSLSATFSPTSRNSDGSISFHPNVAGSHVITTTNDGGMTDASPITVTIADAPPPNPLPTTGIATGWPKKFLVAGRRTSDNTPYWGISVDGKKFYNLPHPTTVFAPATADEAYDASNHLGFLPLIFHSGSQPYVHYYASASDKKWLMKMVWAGNWVDGDDLSGGSVPVGDLVFSKVVETVFAQHQNPVTDGATTYLTTTSTLVCRPGDNRFLLTNLPGITNPGHGGTIWMIGYTGTVYVAIRSTGYNGGAGSYNNYNDTYYTSTDGILWTGRTLTSGHFPHDAVPCSPSAGGCIFHVGFTGGDASASHVAMGTLDGLSWYVSNLAAVVYGSEWYETGVYSARSDTAIVISNFNGIHRSGDGGQSFSARIPPGADFIVDCVATTNVTRATLQTLDGFATTGGKIALLAGQTIQSENGPWVVSTGAWTRPSYWSNGSSQKSARFYVRSGTSYHDTGWDSSPDPLIVDTTAATMTQDTSSGGGAGGGLVFTVGKKFFLVRGYGYVSNKLAVSHDDGASFVPFILPFPIVYFEPGHIYSDGTTYFFPYNGDRVYYTTDFVTFNVYNLVSGDIYPGNLVDYIPAPDVVGPFAVIQQVVLEALVLSTAPSHANTYQVVMEVLVDNNTKTTPDLHGGFA